MRIDKFYQDVPKEDWISHRAYAIVQHHKDPINNPIPPPLPTSFLGKLITKVNCLLWT